MEGNKIKYSKEFRSINGTEWIGVDVVVNEGETWDEKWKEAKFMVNKFAMNNGIFVPVFVPSGPLEPEPPIQSVDYKAKDERDILIDKICEAKDDDELLSLRTEAVKFGIMSLFETKLQSLQK